jgi:hypothetical protein
MIRSGAKAPIDCGSLRRAKRRSSTLRRWFRVSAAPRKAYLSSPAEEQQVPPIRFPIPSGRGSSGRDDNSRSYDNLRILFGEAKNECHEQ